MTTPSWTTVAIVPIEAKNDQLWTAALEFAAGSRLLRFRISDKDEQNAPVPTTWKPSSVEICGANGSLTVAVQATALLCPSAPYGSLIGKIGGSASDLPDPAAAAAASPAFPGRRVFAVGTYAVVLLGKDDGGPVFLAMNDTPGGFASHEGKLHVLIEEGLV